MAVPAQTSPKQLRSRLPEGDPFVVGSGSTFSASAPGSSKTITETKAQADRARIVTEFREAQSLIAANYAGSQRPSFEDLTRSAMTSMLHELDPHSNFYSRSQWKELLDEQQSGYAGIGTSLAAYSNGKRVDTYIVSTFDGTAAKRAHLRFGDRIVAVNGVNVEGRSIDDVRDNIRGPIGTTVKLTIERGGTSHYESVDLRRGIVPQPSIPDSYIVRPGIGYIDLSEGFNYTTDSEFGTALRNLKQQGMRSLLLDLRGNGGGIVDQAVKVAERFLPRGTMIVSQRGRTPDDYREWVSANPSPETMPLVLLVDENTASASEIVAGAFQDNDRALIVGERTFGKGLVQNVIDLPLKTGLTLTAARYYTPSGRSIQRDYSHISRYEYFSHLTPASEIGDAYFEAKTVTNRRVHGGDGITPDEKLPATELTPVQVSLLDPIFMFARQIAVRSETQLASAFPHASVLNAENLTAISTLDEMLPQFPEFAAAQGFPLTPEILTAENEFIKDRLLHHIATAAFGSVLSLRVLKRTDPQLILAINTLPKAADLKDLAAAARSRARK